MVGPVPGISAHRLPRKVPRIMAGNASLKSFLLGHMSRSRTLAYLVSMGAVWLTVFMNSAMPNRPSASATISTPSSSSVIPKAKRGVPVSMSAPTMPSSRPNTVMATPLIGEPRASVEAAHRMGRVARQVEQDRADGAAILRAVEDAGEHQDGADRLHPEGERQQDRDGRQHTHAGQHADDVADQHPDEAPHHVMRLERDPEAVPKIGQCRRDHSLPPAPHRQ